MKHLPNLLTTLRLVLVVPICLLIIEKQFAAVLWLSFIAGVSDGLDGWLARKLNAHTRYGEVVDPLADKALLTATFICLAIVSLIPIWLAIIALLRDLIIVAGAFAYHRLVGRYDMAPSFWGKLNTFIQIIFILMIITQQVWAIFPSYLFDIGIWSIVGLAIISGGHYVFVWGSKAFTEYRKNQK